MHQTSSFFFFLLFHFIFAAAAVLSHSCCCCCCWNWEKYDHIFFNKIFFYYYYCWMQQQQQQQKAIDWNESMKYKYNEYFKFHYIIEREKKYGKTSPISFRKAVFSSKFLSLSNIFFFFFFYLEREEILCEFKVNKYKYVICYFK